MSARFQPASLAGSIQAIPSKSDAHRLLVCAALADRETVVILPESSQDLDATIRCMTALGADFTRAGDRLHVRPVGFACADIPLLDCGESGSTLRFLMPVAAALRGCARITGQAGLAARPVETLCRCLEAHGVRCTDTHLPLALSGQMSAGHYSLPGDVSSQYISGLLFALPLLEGDSDIHLTSPLQSRGYVQMTLESLRRFSVRAEETPDGFHVPGGQRYRSPGELRAEGDWSNAAFFLVAGALGGPVTVTGLRHDSLQRDREAVAVLRRMGAQVEAYGSALTVTHAPLHGVEVDVSDIPDLVPALAVAAGFAQGRTVFYNAERLRIKESDRLESVGALLRALGIEARAEDDRMIIEGNASPYGGHAQSCNDHRIAMACAVAAAFCTGETVLEQPLAVQKSYPGFYRDYQLLGGKTDVL